MMLAFSPELWGFVANQHGKALMTTVGFEMLDRVPAKQPADTPVDDEDPMAHKTAA